MKEEVKSYYQSTDPAAYNKYKRKLNYLNLFPSNEGPDSTDEDASSTKQSNSDFLSVFSPVDYKINTSPLEIQEEADGIIAGLIQIMDSDPKLRGKFRITSLYREGATTKQGRASFHSSGQAVDIVPVGGTFDTLEANMMANRELVTYMIYNRLGILDEYTSNGYQARTGATGNHMHIGPDQLALSGFQKLLKKHEINIET